MNPLNNESRILLIEDDKTLSKLTIMLLKNENIETLHAQDGKQALELLEKHSFKLIITDLNMPQTDGMTLITQLRKQGLKTPIIVTTGVTNIKIHEQLHELGIEKIYVKPLMAHTYYELIEDIKRYL